MIGHGQYRTEADGTKTPLDEVLIGKSVKYGRLTAPMSKIKALLNPKNMEANRSVLVACHQDHQLSNGGWNIVSKIETEPGKYTAFDLRIDYNFSPMQIEGYNK